jgi:hypothetical protein
MVSRVARQVGGAAGRARRPLRKTRSQATSVGLSPRPRRSAVRFSWRSRGGGSLASAYLVEREGKDVGGLVLLPVAAVEAPHMLVRREHHAHVPAHGSGGKDGNARQATRKSARGLPYRDQCGAVRRDVVETEDAPRAARAAERLHHGAHLATESRELPRSEQLDTREALGELHLVGRQRHKKMNCWATSRADGGLVTRARSASTRTGAAGAGASCGHVEK